MKSAALATLFALAAAAAGLILTAAKPDDKAADPAGRVPVLVELFTSEGCSSCPPADTLLAELLDKQPVDGVEIIGVGRHVTYWDNLGHADPFADKANDARQRAYAKNLGEGNVYTPQAVVDGKAGVVGSNKAKLRQLIQTASAKPRLVVSFDDTSGRTLRGHIDLPDDLPSSEIWVALIEGGLSTKVERGENAGRLLKHPAVARLVRKAGRTGGDRVTFEVKLPDAAQTGRCRLVAFAQKPGPGEIVAAGSAAVEAK